MIYSRAICKCCGRWFDVYDYNINTPNEEYCPKCIEDQNPEVKE